MKERKRALDDQGSALLSVLLVVFMMTLLSMTVYDRARFAVRSTSLSQGALTAHSYREGGREAAAAVLEAQVRAAGRIEPMSQQILLDGVPLDVRLEEKPNCFNLNAIAGKTADSPADERQTEAFIRLMQAAGIHEDDARRTASALTDWMDGDDAPGPDGAEKQVYQSRPDPYAPPNRALLSTSELNEIEAFTPRLIERIAPYVCVEMAAEQSIVQVNRLQASDWPLIYAVLPDYFATQDTFNQFVSSFGQTNVWTSGETFLSALDSQGSAETPRKEPLARFVVRPVRASVTMQLGSSSEPQGVKYEFLITETGKAMVADSLSWENAR
jgi:general secretion pathway protein K